MEYKAIVKKFIVILPLIGIMLFGLISFTTTADVVPNNSLLDPEGRMEDSLELVNLYQMTSGELWFVRWNLEEPINTWFGIQLTAEGRVHTINVSENRVFGNLPDLDLPELAYLELRDNKLNGAIPNFSKVPKLKTLNLRLNNLVDTIPDFSNLPLLEGLNLSFNELTGPALDFTNLPLLREYIVENNRLTGPVPNFTRLPLLESLGLGGNIFEGEIPDFSNIPNLINLQVSGDNLRGGIPDFSNLPELAQLNLAGGQLTGNIPDFSNIPELKELYLEFNKLQGQIPDFSNLPEISRLNLEGNRLDGNIPDFSQLSQLEYLKLRNNALEGALPNFTALPQLVTLIADQNKLSGLIPDFSNLPNLEFLQLSSNNFSGELPDFTNLRRLARLIVSGNFLSDSIPNFSDVPRLQILILDENSFSFCPQFTQLPLLERLSVIGNQLTFEDVLRNINRVDAYFYNNQKEVEYPCPFLNKMTQTNGSIPLYFDDNITGNEYEWFKDGLPYLSVFGPNRLDFNDLKLVDSGSYQCKVTNAEAPDLELWTAAIELAVDADFEGDEIIITAEPAAPTLNESVTIFYNVNSGNAHLANCNCDIYVHVGVITTESNAPNDWRYVTTEWGVDNPDWRMTPVPGEPDLYSWTISPSIREYFNIPAEEEALELVFVFRNAEGTIGGKTASEEDIFYPLEPAPTSNAPLQLRIEDAAGAPNDLVCFDFKAYTPTFIGGLDMNIQWDTAVLGYASFSNVLLPDFSEEQLDVSPSLINKGRLSLNWELGNNTPEVNFPEEVTAFQACFTIKADTCLNSQLLFIDAPQSLSVTSSTGGCLFLETQAGLLSVTCEQAFSLPEEEEYVANREYTDETGWTHYFRPTEVQGSKDTLLMSIQKNQEAIGSITDGIFEVKIEKDTGIFDITEWVQQFPTFNNVLEARVLNYFWGVTPNYTALQPDGPFGLRFYFDDQDIARLNQALGLELTTSNIVFFKAKGVIPSQPVEQLIELNNDQIQFFKLGSEASMDSWKEGVFENEAYIAEMLVDSFSYGGMIAINSEISATKDIESLSAVQLFPNPTNGLLRIMVEATATEHLELAVLDYTGKTVRQEKWNIYPGADTRTLDLFALPLGVYLLRLRNDSGQITSRKFVITN